MHVTVSTPAGPDLAACRQLVAASTDTVFGQSRRTVEPDTPIAAAWGDPAIVVTCGVQRPQALRPESQCFRVDGVDWLVTQAGHEVVSSQPPAGTLDFTTVGRSPYVRVSIPDSYQPAADALVDLTPTIRANTARTTPCA